MPKNTPLPMQWLTVNGQNVPIVLPEHWDDDKKEWKTTGTGNPLPIANYTQNASGVWLPTSESNPMPTQLTGSIVEFVGMSDDSIEIPAGVDLTVLKRLDVSAYSSFFIHFYPRSGRSYRVNYFPIRYDENNRVTQNRILDVTDSTSNQISERIPVDSLLIDLSIENRMETDHEFGRLYVFGVRV